MKRIIWHYQRRAIVLVALSILATGCGTNPVTRKSEIQFVSEEQEITIGKQNYVPARQSQGGDYIIDPELTSYVKRVGNKLAAVSDRPLPYEFVVLNNSVPNAWAMPGGKIAVNRGLLYELNSEAELAAVLSHEIVHAAARHGAKSMERGIFLQGTILAVGLLAGDSSYAGLLVGSGLLGSQLIATKYSRDAELESDLYGLQYMKKAGYDPRAAVTLQETFVRLSKDHNSNFLEGLFASHPPSEERVTANKLTLDRVGEGGEWGREIYAQTVGKIKATQAAYKNYDEAIKVLAKNDVTQATALVKQAIVIEPREARFQELLGDIALTEKRPQEALNFYEKAIQSQPDYFKPHVQSGIALVSLGRKREAESYFIRSNELLPNAPSYFYLGEIFESRGDIANAMKNYQSAAGSNSTIGKASTERFIRLDLPLNPGRYLKGTTKLDKAGNLYAVVENPTPITVGRVQVRIVKFDNKYRKPLEKSSPIFIKRSIDANNKAQVLAVEVRPKNQQDLKYYRVVVEHAEALGKR